MKQTPQMHRIAIAALSAAIVFPIAPVFGQDAPAASPPPVVNVSPPPPVSVSPPPPVVSTPPVAAPQPRVVTPLEATRAAPAPAATRTPALSTRTAPRTRAAAPARQAAPAPAPVAEPVAPPPAALPAEATAPPAVAPLPVVAEPAALPVETPEAGGNGNWTVIALAAGALLLAVIAFFAFRRRRARDEVYEEAYYEEPVANEAPAPLEEEPRIVRPLAAEAAIPVAPTVFARADETEQATAATLEEPNVEEADQADVDALTADSAPVSGRPWIEFLMRPVRAGTSQDDTIVQFELTVGNTGSVAAKDVRISTWMFAAGPGTDMERSLIDPPADATVSEMDIAAGDGARVEAEIALPKSANREESVLPVVVADARYTLPDGSEGRTSASFAIGMSEDGDISPFPADRASGLIENVEARLHGEPERV